MNVFVVVVDTDRNKLIPWLVTRAGAGSGPVRVYYYFFLQLFQYMIIHHYFNSSLREHPVFAALVSIFTRLEKPYFSEREKR